MPRSTRPDFAPISIGRLQPSCDLDLRHDRWTLRESICDGCLSARRRRRPRAQHPFHKHKHRIGTRKTNNNRLAKKPVTTLHPVVPGESGPGEAPVADGMTYRRIAPVKRRASTESQTREKNIC